jgi:pyrroline-5-carboxylate reductase
MGKAIAEQLKSEYQLYVFDKDKAKTDNLKDICVTGNILDLVKRVDAIILAVKPQDFDGVLEEIKSCVLDKLIISIAAGIKTAYIEKRLGAVRVIRAMPNIGIKIGQSQTFLCLGSFALDSDLEFTEQLFSRLGTTWKVKEAMVNPATAISASGPAYIYYDIELNSLNAGDISEKKKQEYINQLREAALALGFNANDAGKLAISVVNTSLNLIKETELAPSELRKQITSKAGTTEAALRVLEQRGSWTEAALAALRRAEELSK